MGKLYHLFQKKVKNEDKAHFYSILAIVSSKNLLDNDSMFQFSRIISFLRKNILELIASVFLIILLISTWFLLNKKESFPEEIHLAIQEEFQKVVREKLLEKNPLAEEIQFHELWTETMGDSSQIRAVFSYSFNDSADPEDEVVVTVKGSALINKKIEAPTSSSAEHWEIGSFDVDHTEMSFNNEVLVILPKEEDSQ